jgi:3-carboxy-cis,cis-muconate cycloisomerase
MPERAADASASLRGVQQLFGPAERVQKMLDVEAALARAQAALGIVPAHAAEVIAQAARADGFDLEALASAAPAAGNLAIPLVKALTDHVRTADADAARFVHWGATSQDVIDTGLVLQIREALPIVLSDLDRAATAAAAHARRHATTPMAARTWLQQAAPTTFGLKAAGWLDALGRTSDGVRRAVDAACVLQFGGAAGTLAALGERGLEVAERLGGELGLPVPVIPWHAQRERLAALACALGVLCGTLGKIARDLSLLAQTEIDEVAEGRPGGSSAMPHKRNPVMSARALAAAVRAPGLVATMLSAMPQEHERALGGWQAEWDTLPTLVIVAADGAEAVAEALEGLEIHAGRMRRNLDVTRGLVMAEAVAMTLAPHIGRAAAHELVEAATRRAIEEDRALADVLTEDAAITRWLDRSAIEAALRPESYLGAAAAFVSRVLSAARVTATGDAKAR